MNDPLFYMQDTRSPCGSNVMFWRKGGKGYGTNLNELETYNLQDAQAQYDRRDSDVPLLKSLVDELSILAVDHQYLPHSIHAKDLIIGGGEYVVQVKGNWNGNDILFIGDESNSYNYSEAKVLSSDQAKCFSDRELFSIFIKKEIDKIARHTFQICNINKNTMIKKAGIKIRKPKRVRQTTGKYRGNCPVCGKLTWDFDPHINAHCSDHD